MSAENSGSTQRIPLHWAVSILVILVLPLSFYLGKYNIPLWVAFIVWAEYFVFGAKPESWKIIVPSLTTGTLASFLWCLTAVWLSEIIPGEHSLFWGFVIGNLIFVTLVVYLMGKVETLATGSLPLFNGLTLYLAVYFTNSVPAVGPMSNPYWILVLAFIWTTLMAYFGWFMGWFNIVLTLPRKAVSGSEAK